MVATVLGILLTANLGAWQLRRAAQKIALQDALESRARLPALSDADLARTPERHFGFEGAAWYWHFVDVVWLGLYIVVYWL